MRPLFYGALLSLVSLLFAACSGNPIPPPNTPTAEMQVVEFATVEATATTANPPTPTVTPTTSPTAESVAADKNDTSLSGPAEFKLSRSPDENPLTGLKVDDQALIHRRPLLVRVGNDFEARPQVGLNEADIVYEELVEWWITRFTAIYLSQDLETIAPIRSMRLINLQLAPQYQGALAHSGGSDPVRFLLSQTGITNLDEFYNPDIYFYRDNENWATRLAFDAKKAREYMLDEGLESDVGLRGFVFAKNLDTDTLPTEAVAEAQEVTIPYPPSTSEAKWVYDKKSGRYLRFTTGDPMEDFEGNQISAANVVIYFAEHEDTDIVEDSNGATSVNIFVNGFGTAWIIRDGQILKGNWQTDGSQTPNFIFNNGSPIPLKPGNTWVEVVPPYFDIEIDGQYHARLGEVKDVDAGEVELDDTPESEEEPTGTLTPTATPIGFRATVTPTPKPSVTPASQ
jgi:hypothetical protein